MMSELTNRLSASRLVGLAAASACIAGFIDVGVAILGAPRDFGSLDALCSPVLATAAIAFPVFLLLQTAIAFVATRVSVEPGDAVLGLAVGLLTSWALWRLLGLEIGATTWPAVFRAAAVAIVAAWSGAGVAPAASVSRGVRLFVVAPVVLAQVLSVEWMLIYAPRPLDRATVLAVLATLALAFVSARGLWRLPTRWAATALVTLVVILVGGPPASRGWHALADPPHQMNDGEAAASARHVVLITADTLRRDALSVYDPRRVTPAIDALAADSVVFDSAWSVAPWTLPAVSSILTGLTPEAHGVGGRALRLPDEVTTVAERFTTHGYRTGAILFHRLLMPARNFGQGFADYRDLHEPAYGTAAGVSLLQRLGVVPPTTWPTTADQTAIVNRWVDAHQHEPFFLWVHYFDPHAPYAPPLERLPGEAPAGMGPRFDDQAALSTSVLNPTPEARRWVRALYDAEVTDVDANVGRLLDHLRTRDLYDDAVVIFSSDHGEEFWDRGRQGHGQSLHAEQLRVPLIVKSPRSSGAVGRVGTPVSTASIAPTLMTLAGLPVDLSDYSVPSLEPLIGGDESFDAGPVVSSMQWTVGELTDHQRAVTFGDYRYIGPRVGVPAQIFDVRDDPGEFRPLLSDLSRLATIALELLSEDAERASRIRERLGLAPGQ